MAIRDWFITAPQQAAQKSEDHLDIAASLAPLNTINSLSGFLLTPITATRDEAMAVPTIARARNIIAASIASIPLHIIDESTGQEIYPPRIINQPDKRVTGYSAYSFIVEDLLFYGVAYLQIMELYADTGRIRDTQRIAPDRVQIITNAMSTEITGYRVDGMVVPNQGVGSLAVFNGIDEGLLNRAGRTIKAAFALEKAATIYAQEPYPTMVLKSSGTALPADRIRALLDSWKVSRAQRSTAFLNADIELQSVGYDPKSLQLNEAREQVSTELCRAIGLPAYYADANTGSSMTYSNATLARQSLFDFSLRNFARAIETRLSMPDYTPAGQTVRYDLDDYLRGSAKERAEVYEILNRIGAMSIEEIREEEDLIR
jgi:HK97 family phage portal protein